MYVGGFQHTGHWSGGSHTGRVYQMRKEDGNGPISKKKAIFKRQAQKGAHEGAKKQIQVGVSYHRRQKDSYL